MQILLSCISDLKQVFSFLLLAEIEKDFSFSVSSFGDIFNLVAAAVYYLMDMILLSEK